MTDPEFETQTFAHLLRERSKVTRGIILAVCCLSAAILLAVLGLLTYGSHQGDQLDELQRKSDSQARQLNENQLDLDRGEAERAALREQIRGLGATPVTLPPPPPTTTTTPSAAGGSRSTTAATRPSGSTPPPSQPPSTQPPQQSPPPTSPPPTSPPPTSPPPDPCVVHVGPVCVPRLLNLSHRFIF